MADYEDPRNAEWDRIRAVPTDLDPNMVDTLARYVAYGTPTGSFTEAVLSNDLFEAIGRADAYNEGELPNIVRFIYQNLPIGCHGSRAAYANWLRTKREEANAYKG